MNSNDLLKLRYDAVTQAFFSLVDTERLDSEDYLAELRGASFLDAAAVEKMQKNVPVVNGQRVPGECDVLSTYFVLSSHSVNHRLDYCLDDVLDAIPPDIDVYRTPHSARHVCLVMLHDLRPTDLDDVQMREAILSDQLIDRISAQLERQRHEDRWPSVQLQLHGLRIGLDGAVIAVFTDDGGTDCLRRSIAAAVSPYVHRNRLKYRKPFIHVTLARILGRLDFDTILRLFDKQRRYLYVGGDTLGERVEAVHLGRETRWMHSDIRVLRSFALKNVAHTPDAGNR